MATFTCYRPTPLERAHATYLLVTYFNTPVDMANDDGEMRVAGRDAVPFLTSSGVDRSLLRLIWSIADPEGIGTLTVRSQFHTILRLIAMAQANFLPPLPPGIEHQHPSLLKEALTNNSHLVMALPTFTGDASPPTVAHLLGTYPTPVSRGVGYSCEGHQRDGSNVDVSNLLTDHDFQYQLWQKQQRQQRGKNSGGDASWGESWGVSATPATKMSVDDAFGDLPDVEDLPLPSLQYVVSEDNIETCEGSQVDEGNDRIMENHVDEFGDFDGESGQPSIVQEKEPQPGTENLIVDGMNNGEILPIDLDATYPPFPSSDVIGATVGSAVAGIEVGVDISDNDFSDFNAAPDSALTLVAGNQPLTEFDNVNSAHLSMTIQHGPTLSISDAFEPLVVEQESTSGLIEEEDQFGGFERTDKPMDEADEQDDFGGFESTLSQPNDDDKIDDKDDGDEFGGFKSEFTRVEGTVTEHRQGGIEFYPETDSNPSKPDAFPNRSHLPQVGSLNGVQLHQQGTHHATLSITDAFDSLVSQQEVLSVPAAQQSTNDTIASLQNVANINDEFGGFESEKISSPESEDPNDEIVAELQNTLPNTQEQISESLTSDHARRSTPQLGNHVPTLSISDAFASLIGDQESSAAPGNNFAFVTSSVHTKEENHGVSSDSACREASSDSTQVSIFDEKKTSDDDKIKPESEQPLVDNNEMDLSIQGDIETGIQSTGLSAFDDVFGGIQDAPLPPLEAFSPTLEERGKSDALEMSEFDESFGDFEGHATGAGFIPEGEFVEKSAFADAGVGNFESIPQTLMVHDLAHHLLVDGVSSDPHTLFQPLETFPPEAVERENMAEFDDSFGDFEGTSVVPDRHEGPTDASQTFAEYSLFSGNTASNFDNCGDQNVNEADKATNYNISAKDALPPLDIKEKTDDKLDHEKHDDFLGFPTYGNVAFSQANGIPDEQTSAINQRAYEDNDIAGFSAFDGAFPTEDGATLEDKRSLTQDEVAQVGGKAQPIHGFQAFLNTQFEATTELSNANDDDFGDFPALGPADIVQAEDRMDHQRNHSSISHEMPEALAHFHGNNTVHTEADDDDFGDFAAFGSPDIAHTEDRTDETQGYHITANYQSETTVGLHGDAIVHSGVDCDDIGGFSAFGTVDHAKDSKEDSQYDPVTMLNMQSEATADLRLNNAVHIEADDHDFVDFSAFGSAGMLHTEDRVHTHENHSTLNKFTEAEADLHAEADDDDFGDFSAFGSAGMLHTEDRVQTKENHSTLNKRTEAEADLHAEADGNDFGDFSSFGPADMLHTENRVRTQENDSSLNKRTEAEADLHVDNIVHAKVDDFGDFAAFGSADMLHTEDRVHTHGDHSTRSIKQAEAAVDLHVDNIDQDEDFDGFAAFGSTDHTQDDDVKTSNMHAEAAADLRSINIIHNGVDEHDFEGFAAFGSTDASHTEDRSHHTQEDLSNVSNKQVGFPTNLHGNNAIPPGGDDDSVGNFAAFVTIDSTAIANASDAISFNAEFGEFAEFDSAPPNDAPTHVGFNHSSHSCSDLRERIHSLEQLPSPLPPKEIIVQCFEKSLKTRESPRVHLARCVLLCEVLSDANSDLSQQWENAISSVKFDLERGRKVLDFFSGRLTPADRSMILRSEKLHTYILGLAEFVRISRLITASIHDILCLEINRGSQESPSNWNTGKLITSALVIEEAWDDICSKALDMGVFPETPQVESIEEIRSRYLNIERGEPDELCQLTLQPLNVDGEDQGTRSAVKWNGKQYLVCAANFLANRLSQQACV